MLSDCKNIKIKITIKDINRPPPKIWKSNLTHLNKLWVKEKSKKEIRKYFELIDKVQYIRKWNESKTGLIRKSIALNDFTQKEESCKMYDW